MKKSITLQLGFILELCYNELVTIEELAHDENPQRWLESRGVIVLGNSDPTGLTNDEFRNSPDLLFHGANKDFVFRRDYDYESEHVDVGHSHTVGAGFYATNKRSDAVLFSEAFGAKDNPIVVEVLPYQARMFDFRAKGAVDTNAPVPEDLLQDYIEYVRNYFERRWGDYNSEDDSQYIASHPIASPTPQQKADGQWDFDSFFNTPKSIEDEERSMRVNRLTSYSIAQDYMLRLQTLKDIPTDVRQMLSATGEARVSEFASHLFSDFMLFKGYDGVVYIEGGDNREHHNPVSYVFYNLDTLGTFDIWNTGILS